jgi:hypothetical protein
VRTASLTDEHRPDVVLRHAHGGLLNRGLGGDELDPARHQVPGPLVLPFRLAPHLGVAPA